VAFSNRFGRAAFRPDPRVDEVQIRRLRADIQLDMRANRSELGRGWFANAMFERAGGVLGGDAEYRRYLGRSTALSDAWTGDARRCAAQARNGKGLITKPVSLRFRRSFDIAGLRV